MRARDSEIRETPIQAVKRHAESRKGKCFRAHQTRLCGSRWHDLIGQPGCGLEALIGWEPRTHAGTNGLSKTSSTDLIEMATTHYVKDVNRAYVDVLLTNAICGNIVTASSADGTIYVRRLCRCTALYNDFFVNYQLSTIYTLSQTAQPLQITEGSKYLCRHS